MTKFTHLHLHSHYSLLDGLSKIDNILDKVKEMGMDSVALTDHGVMYGAVEFYEKAKAKGIKPIIGCEFYEAVASMDDKTPQTGGRRYHLILLAKNQQGYNNLVKLVTEAHLRGFYYKPRIDLELLEKYSEGLICLSACIQGRIPFMLLAGKIDEAEEMAQRYEKLFGQGNYYLEIQPHPNLPDQIKANKLLIELAKKTGIPLVATTDSHYINKDDAEAQDILMLINTGADINDKGRLSMLGEDFSMKSGEEMAEAFAEAPEAITNTQKITEACNLELKLGQIKLPYFEVPDNKTHIDYLRELCYLGVSKKYKIEDEELNQLIAKAQKAELIKVGEIKND